MGGPLVSHGCELVTFYWIIRIFPSLEGSFCTTSKNGGEETADASDWIVSYISSWFHMIWQKNGCLQIRNLEESPYTSVLRPINPVPIHCNWRCRKMEKRRMEKRNRSNISQQYMAAAQSLLISDDNMEIYIIFDIIYIYGSRSKTHVRLSVCWYCSK